MEKKYVSSFIFSITFILCFSVIIFMIMLPQSVNITKVNSYIDIEKEDYTFKKTKDISDEALSYQYTVTGEDIENFKRTNEYKMGNENPFYDEN